MNTEQRIDTRTWLETATSWRFLSLLFQSPKIETRDEMRALAGELPLDRRQLALKLASCDPEAWEMEFHRVLGPAGIPACESSYDDNALAGRGPTLARIAGFYEAFAFKPSNAKHEVPDHISVELGFLSYLAVKIAYAEYEGDIESSEIAINAYGKFLNEHLGFWVEKLVEMLQQAGSPFYSEASTWLIEQAGRIEPVNAG